MPHRRHRHEPFGRFLHHKQQRSASDLHPDERQQSDRELRGEPSFAGRNRSLRESRSGSDRQCRRANERRAHRRFERHQSARSGLWHLTGGARRRRRGRRRSWQRRQRRSRSRWRSGGGHFHGPGGQWESRRPSRADCGRRRRQRRERRHPRRQRRRRGAGRLWQYRDGELQRRLH